MRSEKLSALQHLFQILPCIGALTLGDLFRCAGGDDLAAVVPALGSQVDDVVGGLDDVQIVLDHHHRVACVHQRLQHVDQLVHIRRV